jgi:rhodanese-related sulfurtransferase
MRFHNIPIGEILSEAIRRGGIIVDVRESEEFSKGHIPMAVNVPIEEIKAGRCMLPKNRTLLIYCKYGGASSLAAKLLSQEGYTAINTVGGLVQYKGALTKER